MMSEKLHVLDNDALQRHALSLMGQNGGQRLVAAPDMVINTDLRGADLRWSALIRVDLSGVDMTGANLHRADLTGANLHWANLSEANLSEANLRGADLSGANLRGADLSGANLSEANLRRANLREANLTGANLHRANLSEANLSEANLRWADLSGANLRGANLTGANLRGAELDYSCWPLWCGSQGAVVDARLAAQLAAHFCALTCDDPAYQEARAALLPFARTSHRARDLSLLEDKED